MFRILPTCLLLMAALLACPARAQAAATTPTGQITLFNGTNFAGLYPWFSTSGFSDPNQVFRVTNGLLHITGDGWGALTTSNAYRDYVMVLEFKWGPRTWAGRQGLAKDGGVLFHSQGIEGGWSGLLMPGIQAQVIDGGIGDLILMRGEDGGGQQVPISITVPVEQVPSGVNPPNWNYRGGYRWNPGGAPATFNQSLDSVHWSGWDSNWVDVVGYRGQTVVESPDGQWNRMVVVASNDTFQIFLNGSQVNAASNVVPSEGKLQLEVEFAEHFVRRWELWPLGQPVGPVIQVDELPPGVTGAAYSQSISAAGVSNLAWSVASGTLPPGLAINPTNGLLSGTPTGAGAFHFTVQVADAAGGQAQQPFQVTVTPAGGVLVTNGLVLHLDSAQGVTVSGSNLTAWADLSGKGNHVVPVGNPLHGTVLTPLGLPAVRLDGIDDELERDAVLNGFPAGNSERTMFLVAKYNSSTWWAGVAYGNAANNEAFGLVARHPTGELVLHGYGGGNDLVSTSAGLGAGWLIHSGLVSGGAASHYKDGALIGEFLHGYNTGLGRFLIGADLGGAGHVGMEVAAILLYNRALNTAERADVGAYLQSRYLTASGLPVITVPADIVVAVAGGTGAVVNFTTSAMDGLGNPLATTNTPPSGSFFPLGTTTVTTTTADAAGNSASRTFTVTVLVEPPPVTPQSVVKFIEGDTASLLYTWSPALGIGEMTDRYSVSNGTLHVVGDEGGAVISKDRYRDYLLVLEYKWGPRQWGPAQGHGKNSGLLIHSRGYEGGYENRNMPGLEVQMLEGSAGDFLLEMGNDQFGQPLSMSMRGNVGQVTCIGGSWNCRDGYRWVSNGVPRYYDYQYGTVHWYGWDPAWTDVTGFRGAIDHESPDGQWNQILVRVQGGLAATTLNGVKVNEIYDALPAEGKVQLEIEGSEYFVRRFELWPLGSLVGPAIRNDTLPAGAVGQPYQQPVSACAGNGALNWSLAAGLLPPGLALNATNGLITGAPAAGGAFGFTARVTDSAGLTAEQAYQLVVAPSAGSPVITLLGANPLVLAVGELFTDPGATALDAQDGNVTPLLVAGGQAVNTNSPGAYTRTYTVTDSNGNTSQAQRVVLVVELVAPTLQPQCLQNTANDLRITFPTVLGLDYTILSSTNLMDWQPIQTRPGDGWLMQHVLPGGCLPPHRFFKAGVTKSVP